MQYLREAAQSGDTRAMFALSLRLNTAPKTHTGGAGDDTDEGIAWLEKAAAGGHPKALYNLALHLQREAGKAALSEAPDAYSARVSVEGATMGATVEEEEEEEEEEEKKKKSGGAPMAGKVKEKGSPGSAREGGGGGGSEERVGGCMNTQRCNNVCCSVPRST